MKAVVALGSNLENRKLNLDIAITHLEELLQDLKVFVDISSDVVF